MPPLFIVRPHSESIPPDLHFHGHPVHKQRWFSTLVAHQEDLRKGRKKERKTLSGPYTLRNSDSGDLGHIGFVRDP